MAVNWDTNLAVVVLLIVLLLKLMQNLKRSKEKHRGTEIQSIRGTSFPLPLLHDLIMCNRFRNEGVALLDDIFKDNTTKVVKSTVGFKTIYLVRDMDIIQKLLKSPAPGHLHKPKEWYDFAFQGHGTDALVATTLDIWAPHRKAATNAFTYSTFGIYLRYINDCANDLVREGISLEELSKGGVVHQLEMRKVLEDSVVKFITQVLMGSAYSAFSADETASFHESYRISKEIIVDRLLNPILFFPPIWYFHPNKPKLEQSFANEIKFAKEIVDRYRKNGPQAIFVEPENRTSKSANGYKDESEGQVKTFGCVVEQLMSAGLSNEEIVGEIGGFLSAGYDTVRVSLDMLIFQLALHPEYQKRCQEEVDYLFNTKAEDGSFVGKKFTMDDLSNLKYVEQCIQESLRLTPTVPFYGRLLQQPLEISKEWTINPGAIVVVVAWSAQRDPDVYPQPEKYDPDRFSAENVKARHPYSFLPFSMGPRNCLGYKLALMQMKVYMACILRNYNLSTTDKPTDVRILFDVSIRPERPYNVTYTRRACQ